MSIGSESAARPLAQLMNEIIAAEAACLSAEARRREADRDRQAAADTLARLRREIDTALADYEKEPAEPLYFPTHPRSLSAG